MKWLFLMFLFEVSGEALKPKLRPLAVFASEGNATSLGGRWQTSLVTRMPAYGASPRAFRRMLSRPKASFSRLILDVCLAPFQGFQRSR